MDPLRDLRVSDDDARSVDPLTRARLRMEAGEAAEERAAQARREAAAELARSRLMALEARDRMELVEQGFLSREVAAVHAEAEARRGARIAELTAELGRLTGRGGQSWRPPDASDVEAQLEAHRAEVAAWNTPAMRRIREAALTDELARSRGVSRGGRDRPPITRAEPVMVAPPALARPAARYPDPDLAFGLARATADA